MSFTLKHLFKAQDPILKWAMQKAWQHCVYEGAIAWTLARHTGTFSPEEAMSAAIISNIGVLSVFNYLVNHPELCEDPAELAG